MVRNVVLATVSIGSLFVMFILAFIIINGIFLLFNFRREELLYVKNKVMRIIMNRK